MRLRRSEAGQLLNMIRVSNGYQKFSSWPGDHPPATWASLPSFLISALVSPVFCSIFEFILLREKAKYLSVYFLFEEKPFKGGEI